MKKLPQSLLSNRQSRRSSGWTNQQIQEFKQQIREQLAQFDNEPKLRLDTILQSIAKLDADDSPEARLKRFIFVVSAMVHHERFGGLRSHQISSLVKLGHAILGLQGIRPGSSSLDYLYGELHLALSHIYSKTGSQWQALWEQQMASTLGKRSPTGGKGFEALALGIRALRLGNASTSINELQRALSLELDPHSRVRAQLELHKALRLSNRFDEAKQFVETCSKERGLSDEELREFEWETMCASAQQTGNVEALVFSVMRNKSHNDYAYVPEAFLWSRSVSGKKWLDRFPKMKNMARNTQLKTNLFPALTDAASMIETCYDYDIPLLLRTENLGATLAHIGKLPTIDWELLLWAAAARWLSRSRSPKLVELVVAEYRSLSRRLSDGRCDDVLGLVSDIHHGEEQTDGPSEELPQPRFGNSKG